MCTSIIKILQFIYLFKIIIKILFFEFHKFFGFNLFMTCNLYQIIINICHKSTGVHY